MEAFLKGGLGEECLVVRLLRDPMRDVGCAVEEAATGREKAVRGRRSQRRQRCKRQTQLTQKSDTKEMDA